VSRKGKKGFQSKRKSYVDSHQTHLLSGALKCDACGGAIALVSGKGSGYYGCLNASRHACENKVYWLRKMVRILLQWWRRRESNDPAVSSSSGENAEPASTRPDCHSTEPGLFHPDPRFGATSGNIRAT
jgi:hypothetical protein